MNFHQTANALEAMFWFIIGGGFLWQALHRRETTSRKRCGIAAGAFLLFGLSDVIEITTGAWWRPWWLFLLKALCLVTLVGLYIGYRLARRKKSAAS